MVWFPINNYRYNWNKKLFILKLCNSNDITMAAYDA